MMHAQSRQYIMLDNYAGVAQLVEQGTEDPRVGGSIPSSRTKVWGKVLALMKVNEDRLNDQQLKRNEII